MKKIHVLLLMLTVMLLAPMASFAQQVVLKTDTVQVACGSTDTVLIPVSVLNFNQLGGIQFTLEWDVTKMKYIHIQDFNPLLEAGFVGMDTLTNLPNGQFTFSWLDGNGLTIPNSGNNTLFKVAMVRLGGAFTPLAFDNTPIPNPPPTAINVADANFSALPFTLSVGGIKTIDPVLPTIACPANLTVNASGPAVVNNIASTPFDACGISHTDWVAIGASVAGQENDADASGSTFSIGETQVTYIVTDFGGNTAECSFTINVVLDPNLSDSLTFLVSSGAGDCDEAFFVDVTTANFEEVFGAQFSLQWNELILDFDSVGLFNTAINVNDANINIAEVNNGKLSFGWNSDDFTNGSTLPDGARLFRIYFTITGGHGASTAISFTDDPAGRLSIDAALNAIPTKYIAGSVLVDDNQLPVIQCPPAQMVDAVLGQTTATVNGLEPLMLTDNCGTPALTYTPTTVGTGNGSGNANGTFPGGTTQVTYTATDAAGNTASCSFNVTVDVGEIFELKMDTVNAPCGSTTVSIPFRVYNFDDIAGMNFRVSWDETVLQYTGFSMVYPGTGINGSSFPSAAATTPDGYINFFQIGSGGNWPNIPDGGIIFQLNFTILQPNSTTALTFEAPMDAINGSLSLVPFMFRNGLFRMVDLTGPAITCPANVVTVGGSNCTATVNNLNATATDACGTVVSITNNAPAGNIFSPGVTQVTFIATDNSANTSSCTMSVTVNANTALQIVNCPSDTIEVMALLDCSAPIVYPSITAINPCVPAANFTYNYNFPVGTIRPVGITTVVATATQVGNGGGSVTCPIVVEVVDAAAPFLLCPTPVTLTTTGDDCFVVNPVLPQPDVADNCDTDMDIEVDEATIDTLWVGMNQVVFSATDDFNNTGTCTLIVHVREMVAPEVTCPDDIVVPAGPNCNAIVEWDKPEPVDNCTDSGNILIGSTAGSGDAFEVGVHTVTYTVTDASSNTTTCSFTVSVTETTPPVLSPCPASVFILLPPNKCDTMITWTPPTATDNCALDTIISNYQPGVFPAGEHLVLYIAIDEAGNRDSCTFIVSAKDGIAPQFVNFPADITVNNADPCGAILNLPAFMATDNCDPNPVITYAGGASLDTFLVGITRIEVSVEDASGNVTLDTLTVTVNPLQPKSFANIPADQMLTGCAQAATWTAPTIQGFCQTPVVTSSHQSGDIFPVGTTTVTYTATEPNGSTIMISFKITITDPTPPVITCPAAATVNAAGYEVTDPGNIISSVTSADNCQSANVSFGNPVATDNCDATLTVVQTSGPMSGTVLTAGTHTLGYSVTDTYGNVSTCSYTITVGPFAVSAPVIDPNPGCAGEAISIFVPSIPGATYTWTGPQSGYSNSSGLNINSLAAVHTGDYSVVVMLNGCTAKSDTSTLQMAALSNAENDNRYSVGIGDTLYASSVLQNDMIVLPDDLVVRLSGNAPSELIDFNADGTFVFYGSTEGTYIFVYEICSAACPNLCDRATVTIVVRDNKCTFFPNIFTPNGDNTNDYFHIPCLDSGLYPNNSLIIYNQWGDKVFEADGYENTPQKAWNGTLNNEAGQDLPDGVYYYIFKSDASAPATKGFVHIYR